MMNETKPHVLIARAVLTDADDRVLMLKRSSKCKTFPGLWEFPGGKSEHAESFADALTREFKEETSIDVKLGSVLGTSEWEFDNRKSVYLIMRVVADSYNVIISDEHDEYGWFTLGELSELSISPPLKNFILQLQSL